LVGFGHFLSDLEVWDRIYRYGFKATKIVK
jgi:hypothetical protein